MIYSNQKASLEVSVGLSVFVGSVVDGFYWMFEVDLDDAKFE